MLEEANLAPSGLGGTTGAPLPAEETEPPPAEGLYRSWSQETEQSGETFNPLQLAQMSCDQLISYLVDHTDEAFIRQFCKSIPDESVGVCGCTDGSSPGSTRSMEGLLSYNIAVVTQCMLKVNSEAHHHSPRSVAVALGRARVKFNELDLDGNGALEGDELVTLADWVWGQFHPSQQEFDREGYTQKLLSLLDGRLISRVED